MSRRKVSGLEAEPACNHTRPDPPWPTRPSQRPGADDDVTNRPAAYELDKFDRREQAQRIPRRIRWPIEGMVPRRKQDIHRLVRRAGADASIPPRGAVLSPWSIEVSWSPPRGKFTKDAEKLFDDFARRRAIEEAMGLGMTQSHAARAVGGIAKSRGSAIVRETEAAGGANAWFRHEAVRLIWAARTPHGRDTIRSHRADAFFKNLIDAPELERWVYRVGYRSKVDERALEESMAGLDRHEREAVEYLISSGYLWSLFS